MNEPRASVEQRSIPGIRHPISAVTLGVDPPLVGPPALDDRAITLLRRARDYGVTTFDVAGARFPERAERLIARAFPDPDPEVSAIVGRSVESLSRERAHDEPVSSAVDSSGAPLAASLARSRRRLEPVPISVLDWEPEAESSSGSGTAEGLSPVAEQLPEGVVRAVRLTSEPVGFPGSDTAPALFSGVLSLLEPGLVTAFAAGGSPPPARLIARDPFAAGRLDGSRFAATGSLSGPEAGPIDVRSLHDEFDPVVRLAFLTEGRRRTLAQTAVQFVLHWPWVASVVVPLPTPERFDDVLGFAARPPISREELARLGFVK